MRLMTAGLVSVSLALIACSSPHLIDRISPLHTARGAYGVPVEGGENQFSSETTEAP
jgi:hypothetical protein